MSSQPSPRRQAAPGPPSPSTNPQTPRKAMSRAAYQPLSPVSFAANDMTEPFVPQMPRSPLAPVPRPTAAYHVTYSYRSQPPQTVVSNLTPTKEQHTPNTPLSTSKMTLIEQFPNPYHPTQPLHPPLPQPKKPHTAQPRSPRMRLLLLILTLLPLPPLLSLFYFLIGHAILRRALPSDRTWALPYLSSVNAGAIGGTILALPTLLLLLFILYPLPAFLSTEPAHVRDEDFLDDDDDDDSRRAGPVQRATACSAAAVCTALVVCLGGAACPLGVRVVGERVWSPGKAAEAGLLGGAVFAVGVVVASVMALSVLPGFCVVLHRRMGNKC